jgi:purine-binding chemotaxis protein CheW
VNIVVRTDEGPVSILVDSIGGVLEVDRADFELPPETVYGAGRDLIAGVYKVDGPLLHVLDVGRVIGELVTATRKGDA